MASRRHAALVVGAAMIAGCVGTSDPQSDGSVPAPGVAASSTTTVATSSTTTSPGDDLDPPLSAAEQLDQMRAQGATDLELALAEFGAYYGPIPGVVPIDFDDSLHPSITGPLNTLLRRREALTPEQLDVVDTQLTAILDPTRYQIVSDTETDASDLDADDRQVVSTEPNGIRNVAGLALATPDTTATLPPCPDGVPGATAPASPLLTRWRTDVRETLRDFGRRFSIRGAARLDYLVLLEDDRIADLEHSGAGTVLGARDYAGPLLDLLTSCFGPRDCFIMVADTDATGDVARAIAAHELFHCWHFSRVDKDYDVFDASPDWVTEGLAGWVGESLGNGTSYGTNWWRRYIIGDRTVRSDPGVARGLYDLFFGSYTATGFWWHVAEHTAIGLDNAIPQIIELSRSGDSNRIYEGVMRTTDAAGQRTVAAAATQRRDLGTDWVTSAPDIPNLRRVSPPLTVRPGAGIELRSEPGTQTNNEVRFEVAADEDWVVSLAIENNAVLVWSDGEDAEVNEERIDDVRCIGSCRCPDGTQPFTTQRPIDHDEATFTVALSATAFSDARLQVIVEPLECDEEPDEPAAQGGDRDPGRGGSYGHPNLVTFDGVGYIFHGAGDYVLAESITDDFAVHARFSRLNNMTGVSFNRAVAARVGEAVITFGDDADSTAFDATVVRLDGEVLDVDGIVELDADATVRTVDGAYVVRWSDGTELRVGRRVGDQFDLFVPRSRWREMIGLLGNANADRTDDVVTRSGDPADPTAFASFYADFGASWLLDVDDSLFTSALDPADVLPIVPSAQVTLADLAADIRAEAETVCVDAGIEAGVGLAECIFDVAMTGDSRWTDGVRAMAETVSQSVSVGAVNPAAVEDRAPLDGAGEFSGRLSAPLVTDVFTVELDGTDSIELDVLECPNTSTFEAALLSPSGTVLDRTTGPDCGTLSSGRLFVGGEHTIAVSDSGGFIGDYRIDLVLPRDGGEAGEVSVGDTAEFTITDEDRAPSASFSGEAGQVLRFDRLDDLNAGFTSFLLLGPDDEVFDRWPAADDHETQLAVSGRHTLQLDVLAGVGRGPFAVEISEIGRVEPQAVTVDVPFEMVIAAPDERPLATFVATAGDVIVIDNAAPDDFTAAAATFRLYGPDGAEVDWWFVFRSREFVVTVDGAYTLVFEPGSGGLTATIPVTIASG